MQKLVWSCVGAAALAVGVWFFLKGTSHSAPDAAGPAPPAQIMYVCRETGELSRGPRDQTPAVNPATGRATLVQALYCPECRGWRAAPPAEFSERLPLGPQCPEHRAPLSETGPEAELND